jgi:hypothetical protein
MPLPPTAQANNGDAAHKNKAIIRDTPKRVVPSFIWISTSPQSLQLPFSFTFVIYTRIRPILAWVGGATANPSYGQEGVVEKQRHSGVMFPAEAAVHAAKGALSDLPQ